MVCIYIMQTLQMQTNATNFYIMCVVIQDIIMMTVAVVLHVLVDQQFYCHFLQTGNLSIQMEPNISTMCIFHSVKKLNRNSYIMKISFVFWYMYVFVCLHACLL